jgi:hypothetical protein
MVEELWSVAVTRVQSASTGVRQIGRSVGTSWAEDANETQRFVAMYSDALPPLRSLERRNPTARRPVRRRPVRPTVRNFAQC